MEPDEPIDIYDQPDGGEVSEQKLDVPATPKLNGDDLCDVLEAVHDAHSQWHGIGLQLRLPPSALEGIEKEYSNTKDRLREMLKHWFKQATPVPSWIALIEALKSKTVNEQGLAEELEKKHILPLSLSHDILTHTVSNFTDQHKQFLGQLQARAEELESYGESLQRQQSKKVDPSDEVSVAAQDVKQLVGQIATLVEEYSQKAVPVTKEQDLLKDEMESLRKRNSVLEGEMCILKAKLAELEEMNMTEKENFRKERQTSLDKMAEKDEEIAKKAKDVAEKSAAYTSLHAEKEQLENEVQKLAKENELLKSHSQSLDKTSPPETS